MLSDLEAGRDGPGAGGDEGRGDGPGGAEGRGDERRAGAGERERRAFGGRRLQLEDAAAADDLFSVLMGEDVELRRSFIQRNAKDVRFLDI